MSARKIVRLDCDSDGCLESEDTGERRNVRARAQAKEWGWAHRDGKDFCKNCEGYRMRSGLHPADYPEETRARKLLETRGDHDEDTINVFDMIGGRSDDG